MLPLLIETNPFRAFLAKHSIKTTERSNVGGEGRIRVMAPYHGALFRNRGLGLDELAMLAVEVGFLAQRDIESELDNGGVNKLTDLIRRELAGERVKRAVQYESDAEAELGAMMQARYDAMAEAEQALEALATDDEINALLQTAGDEDAEVSNEEIDYVAGLEEFDRGLAEAEGLGRQAQGGAPGTEAGGDPPGGAEARVEGADQVAFGLTAPTPQEVIQRQQAARSGYSRTAGLEQVS